MLLIVLELRSWFSGFWLRVVWYVQDEQLPEFSGLKGQDGTHNTSLQFQYLPFWKLEILIYVLCSFVLRNTWWELSVT
jgi:hypothetical protein